MKNILFISGHNKATTGAHYRFDRLVKSAKDNKYIYWLSPKRDDITWFDDVSSIDATYNEKAKFAYILFLFSSFASLFDLIKVRKKIKHIIVFGEHTLTVALLCKLITKSKLSIGVRSNVIKRYEIQRKGKKGIKKTVFDFHFFLKRHFLKLAYFFSDQIIVQSESAKEIIAAQYNIPLSKIDFIYNDLPSISSDMMALSVNRKYKVKPTSLLFIGNASYIKGLDLILHALLKSNFYFSKFIIAGVEFHQLDDSLKDCITAIKSKCLIECLGRVSNATQLMIESDIIIIPSREDQFPNVALEALATSTPIIGSDIDGISIILGDKDLLFPPDILSLTSKLNMLEDENFYASIVEKSHSRAVLFDFPWEMEYFKLVESGR